MPDTELNNSKLPIIHYTAVQIKVFLAHFQH